jgi:hypothetical protein
MVQVERVMKSIMELLNNLPEKERERWGWGASDNYSGGILHHGKHEQSNAATPWQYSIAAVQQRQTL